MAQNCSRAADHPIAFPSVRLPWRGHRPGGPAVAVVPAVLFALLLINAMTAPLAPFDRPVIEWLQRLSFPGLPAAFEVLDTLTGSPTAIGVWAIVVLVLASMRWWAGAITAGLWPLGGVINESMSALLVERARPHDPDLLRTSSNFEASSFPSGHVTTAVLLYGIIFVVAGQIRQRWLRRVVRTISVGIVLATGVQRVWDGAHWPSDVFASYALGSVLLVGLVAVYRRLLPATDGLPLVHAGRVPHDESVPHAHALTSLVEFEGDRVAKTYAPGLIPRALYWLAFQAPFPYVANRAALVAATHRRNLAADLTAAWYGSSRVARILDVEWRDGRARLISERVDGHAPTDRADARAFLSDLSARFVLAGFPTWQIDPRQPRALDNLIETAPGRYMIVDLESGLVAPLATRTSWRQALARGVFPLFDTVLPDVTARYVSTESGRLRAVLGPAGFTRLEGELAAMTGAMADWRAGEPRVWSRLLTGMLVVLQPWHWAGRLAGKRDAGRRWALGWLERGVATWVGEARLSATEADRLRAKMTDPALVAAVSALGTHVLLSVPLRFPLGSIVRPLVVVGALSVAAGRRATGRSDAATWRAARELHTPAVIGLSALPMVGSFAYLASPSLRSDPLLLRIGIDAIGRRLPWRVYHRSGLAGWIAPSPAGARAGSPRRSTGSPDALPATSRRASSVGARRHPTGRADGSHAAARRHRRSHGDRSPQAIRLPAIRGHAIAAATAHRGLTSRSDAHGSTRERDAA